MKKLDTASLDTLPKRLKALADFCPDREIFIFVSAGRRYALTASRLFHLAGNFAAKLSSHGFRRGDVVANTLPNSPERVLTDVGIILAGCAIMNGQIMLADGSDFFRSARQAKANGVILCPEDWSPAWRLLGTRGGIDRCGGIFSRLKSEDIPYTTTAILVWPSRSNMGPCLLDELESNIDVIPPLDLDICQPDDVVCINTTSGNTGYSKLVPRTHNDIMQTAGSLFTVDMPVVKMFNTRPLGWVGGFPFRNYVVGDVRVLIDTMPTQGIVQLEDVVNAIRSEKCPTAGLLPLEIESMAKYVMDNGLKDFRLELIFTGGQPLKKRHLVKAFQLADTVSTGYGLTEVIIIALQRWKDASEYEDFYAGTLMPGLEIRVLDDENKELPAGVAGHVQVKGSGVFSGYFDRQRASNPETLAVFTEDGWLKTADLGWIRPKEDGTLGVYIMGRAKDVIHRGGILLYPGWLEAKVAQHEDVNEACVLPINDPVTTHKVCLMVKTQAGSDLDEVTLAQFCSSLFVGDPRDQFIPVPDFFKVLKGREFPETDSGKPNLRALRAMAESLFGVGESKQ